MKLRAPKYYKNFHCIADKCKNSCCSAGWEIDIDDETAKFYENVTGEFGDKLKKNIATNSENSSKCFILDKNNNCPFLNEHKLCQIYINLGEENLCNICTEHPRFYEWFKDVKEVGIGLCCEEAARIIISEKENFSTYEIEIPHENCDDYSDEIFSYIFNAREKIISYLNYGKLKSNIRDILWYCNTIQQNIDSNLLDYEEIFNIKKYNLTDITKILNYLLTLEPNDAGWIEYLQNCIEIYKKSSNKISEFENSHPEVFEYLKNISIYFIWRYFLKGVFYEEIISKISLMAISVAVLEVLYFCKWLENGDFALEDCIEITKNYSEEIEYNEENIQRLADACYDLDIFSLESLIGLF